MRDILDIELILTYLAPRMVLILATWVVVFAACLVDLWSGISTAKAVEQKVYSHGLKKTITKFFDYWKVCAFAWMFDMVCFTFDWYSSPYASVLIALCVLLIEGKSVIENNKRKKSNAGKIDEVAKQIVKADNLDDASRVIKTIAELVSTINKNEKWKEEG